MTDFVISPPFGAHALPPKRQSWLKRAVKCRDTALGRAMISFCRKRAIRGLDGPFDVTVEHTIKARLYPDDNRTEKRALAGPQIWETVERGHIARAVSAAKGDFVFVDAGANVGLYALYAEHYANMAGKQAQILAIEPSAETLKRLKTNLTANGSSIQIVELALSDHAGTGQLTGSNGNRGEIKLTGAGGAETVKLDTLLAICQAHGLSHINVLKADIEGAEEMVLRAFFENAPPELHPDILITETRQENIARPLIELCRSHNYLVSDTTRQNSILTKNRNV